MRRFLTVAALALLAAPILAAERIPGTRVSLVPPQGFIAAQRFSGFQDAARGASILVSEFPAPANQMRGSFTESNLQARGMTLRSSAAATFGRLEGDLMAVTQSVNGTPFDKWMAVLGDGTATILVVAAYPQALAAQLSEPMRLAVLSTRWDPAAFPGRFDGRPQNSLTMSKPGDHRRVELPIHFPPTRGGAMNRDEYVQKLKSQLDQWNAEAAKWETKAKDAQSTMQQEAQKQLDALHSRRDAALYQMKLLQGASTEAWQDMMRGADEAWKNMQEAFNRAKSHFEKK